MIRAGKYKSIICWKKQKRRNVKFCQNCGHIVKIWSCYKNSQKNLPVGWFVAGGAPKIDRVVSDSVCSQVSSPDFSIHFFPIFVCFVLFFCGLDKFGVQVSQGQFSLVSGQEIHLRCSNWQVKIFEAL